MEISGVALKTNDYVTTKTDIKSAPSRAKMKIQKDDIVISLTRPNRGAIALIKNDNIVASTGFSVIRYTNSNINKTWLLYTLLSDCSLQQMLQRSSGGNYPAIIENELKKILIPVVDLSKQHKMVNHLEKALREKNDKINKSNEYVAITRKQLFHQLNIDFPEYTPHLFSFTKLADVQKLGMYCNPHSAYLRKVFLQLSNHSWYHGILKDFVDINPPIDKTELTNETKVSFVPMTNVGEKNNKVLYEIKDYQEVKTGFTPFMKGDLLWAKITPCMQNGKSFIADNMPTKHGFGSTEFHVLRLKNENLYLPYLWVILSDSNILEAAQGMFSGSAGQQRVTDVFLENFPVVLPPYNLQIELADKVFSSLQEADVLTQQAEQEWQEAKKQFENELLGE